MKGKFNPWGALGFAMPDIDTDTFRAEESIDGQCPLDCWRCQTYGGDRCGGHRAQLRRGQPLRTAMGTGEVGNVNIEPKQVVMPEHHEVIDIVCDDHHNWALTREGNALTWGLKYNTENYFLARIFSINLIAGNGKAMVSLCCLQLLPLSFHRSPPANIHTNNVDDSFGDAVARRQHVGTSHHRSAEVDVDTQHGAHFARIW